MNTNNILQLIAKYESTRASALQECEDYAERVEAAEADVADCLEQYDFEGWAESEAIVTMAREIITDLKALLPEMGKAIYE